MLHPRPLQKIESLPLAEFYSGQQPDILAASVVDYYTGVLTDRTKKALAAAKAKGKKLGWSIPSRRREQLKASRQGVKSNIAHADLFAENTLPIIREVQVAGITTLQGIAEALNARGVQTARGKKWFPATVKNILARQTRQADTRADAV